MRLAAIPCLLLFFVCAACATDERTSHPEETSAAPPEAIETPPATDTSTTPSPPEDEARNELRAGLNEIASNSDVRVGVSVVELGSESGGLKAEVNENMVFESASLIKVLILAELLRRVDEGSISLEESLGGSTVGSLAEAMISTSDNAAANLLIDRLGFESINALARDLGLEATSLGRKMLDFEARARGEENYTSASDMTALLAAIWEGDLLSPTSGEFAVSALENQRLASKLPAALPSETRILHKTGELENVENDAGIIILPNGRIFAIAVLTDGDPPSGIEAIRRAGRLSYEYFDAPRP